VSLDAVGLEVADRVEAVVRVCLRTVREPARLMTVSGVLLDLQRVRELGREHFKWGAGGH
jgi:hypothetical protein